jgi:hypothetical protein
LPCYNLSQRKKPAIGKKIQAERRERIKTREERERG